MTVVEIPKDTWPGKVREITLGATAGGGTEGDLAHLSGPGVLWYLDYGHVVSLPFRRPIRGAGPWSARGAPSPPGRAGAPPRSWPRSRRRSCRAGRGRPRARRLLRGRDACSP